MKKILFVVMLTLFSTFSFAGVIMTANNERIEDVSIQNETDSTIVYLQDGEKKSIAIEQVIGVLFDNGTYKEFTSESYSGQLIEENTGTIVSFSSKMAQEDIIIEKYKNQLQQLKQEKETCKTKAQIRYYETCIEEIQRLRAVGFVWYQIKQLYIKKAQIEQEETLNTCLCQEELAKQSEKLKKNKHSCNDDALISYYENLLEEIRQLYNAGYSGYKNIDKLAQQKAEIQHNKTLGACLYDRALLKECKKVSDFAYRAKRTELFTKYIEEGLSQKDAKTQAEEGATIEKEKVLNHFLSTLGL